MDESDVPRWSPDDHLDRVYRRGRLLRRRRLVLLPGLPTLLLIVWLALVIAPGGHGGWGCDDDRRGRRRWRDDVNHRARHGRRSAGDDLDLATGSDRRHHHHR